MSRTLRDRRGQASAADEAVVSAPAVGSRTRVASRYGAPVQRKHSDAPSASGEDASSSAPMPEAVQSKMENALGADFSAVRVHQDSDAAAKGALAYTQGSDVHFAPGQYDPHSAGGQQLLGHELTHVVQQSQGRVQATTQAKGAAVNDSPALEQEADQMGARAARGESAASAAGAMAASAGVVQMKREPISTAGMSLLSLAKGYFANLKVGSSMKVQTDQAALSITADATKLDVAAERNQAFVALVDDFKAGLHKSSPGKVEVKLSALGVAISEELVNKKEAERLEADEGGHALGRHGPEVSDDALMRRLFTGLAPDNALSPAPGASSKFNSYTDVLETRQAAASALQTEIIAAAGKVLTWLTTIPGLATAHADAHKDVGLKDTALATATARKTEGFAKKLPDKMARLDTFKKAQGDKKDAEAVEATAKDEMDNPGKNLARLLPGMTNVKLKVEDDAGPGELEDGVTLVESYSIVVDHGKPIGSGFESKESDLIKLKDLLPLVADDAETDAPKPKAKGAILSALGSLNVGGDLNEFATYLDSEPNLATVKKKGAKGAKIYTAVSDAGALTKSFSNFKRGGTGVIFDDSDTLQAIDTAGWDAIQHFPASNSAPDGVQG